MILENGGLDVTRTSKVAAEAVEGKGVLWGSRKRSAAKPSRLARRLARKRHTQSPWPFYALASDAAADRRTDR